MQDSKKTLIALDGVSVAYGEDWAVEGVTLRVQEGEILSLIGPNGAGKSTLLKVMAGLLDPAKGQIRFSFSDGKKSIGYVPQQTMMDRSVPISVLEFLTIKAEKRRWWLGGASGAARRISETALAETGASHLVNRRMGTLSGGEHARVMMAFALLDSPRVLLLDEPMTGVDFKGENDFEKLLLHLNQHRNMTLVMVSHDLHLVSHLSHRVACINRRLHCVGGASEILQEHLLSGIYGAPLSSLTGLGHTHGGAGCCGPQGKGS